MLRGLEHLSHEESLRALGLQPGEKQAKRGSDQSIEKGGAHGAGLFSVEPCDGSRCNRHKLEHRWFHLKLKT